MYSFLNRKTYFSLIIKIQEEEKQQSISKAIKESDKFKRNMVRGTRNMENYIGGGIRRTFKKSTPLEIHRVSIPSP